MRHLWWVGLRRRGERGNDKFYRIARDITVTLRFRGSRVGGQLRDTGLILMRRLIYAAAPFRTATLKTLTAFNFRWPSILFSLVWTTLSRMGCPAAPQHAPHASAKEITCPFPRVGSASSFPAPFSHSRLLPVHPQFTIAPSLALSLRASFISHDSISLVSPWLMVEKESCAGESRFVF